MPSSTASETPEAAKELSLIGKVELRIALTDSDSKLETTLKIYLAPLLLKLGSEHLSVRNKVISVCQHINTRIKPASLKLPVAALLQQFKDVENSLVRHFDLLYVQQGLDRLPVAERLELLPVVMQGLASNYDANVKQASTLWNIFLHLLLHMNFPPRGSDEDIKLREKLFAKAEDAKFTAKWIGKLLLFIGPSAKQCPGLSADELDFINLYGKDNIWAPVRVHEAQQLNLVETKIVTAKFLASGAFIDAERFIPALIASAETNSRISNIGEDILKRALPVTSMEDSALIQQLLSLHLGTKGDKGPAPVRTALQTKILAVLCRSTKVADGSNTMQVVQIIKEGLTSPGIEGLEVSKLRAQVFAFTNWISRIGSRDMLEIIAPAVIGDLRGYIEQQGWPKMSDDKVRVNELSSRGYGYESIGILAQAAPNMLLEPNLDLLGWLFTSLAQDHSGKEISMSIEHALSCTLGAFAKDLAPDIEGPLTDLLQQQIITLPVEEEPRHQILRSTKYIALRFVNRCLPFSNARARILNLWALSNSMDERNEVLEECRKGLDPFWHRSMNPVNDSDHQNRKNHDQSDQYRLPTFSSLVKLAFNENAVQSPLTPPSTGFAAAILFCRSVLFHEALSIHYKPPVVDADWQKNIDALVANDQQARKGIQTYLTANFAQPDFQSSLILFMRAAFDGLVKGEQGSAECGSCILEICALGPGEISDRLGMHAEQLLPVLSSNDHSLRMTASHVFGLLSSRDSWPLEKRAVSIADLWRRAQDWHLAIGSSVHAVHGSIVSLAYYLSRRIYLVDNHQLELPHDAYPDLLGLVTEVLNTSKDKELLEAAVIAVDQFCLFAVALQLETPSSGRLTELQRTLGGLSKSGNEVAIAALGHSTLQIQEDGQDESLLSTTLDVLHALYEKKQPELQFTVGAALSCVAAGRQSTALTGLVDVEGPVLHSPSRKQTLSIVMKRILNDCKTTKPNLRQASAIWLLCLIQYCGHLDEVREEMRSCQGAFKGFLSDRDPLNQETASRGLTLIYEEGDRALKDELIRDLVGTFTGSDANLAGNVSDDTQLFEPGALPTGEGSSVTSYKDIISLANEVGDPGLVYRFMSLAANSAIWSSRAAFGRFGLSRILSDSSVDGYLAKNPKLYPALYRYRFDPNPNVRNSMNDIWSALVKDPTAIIDSYFDNILEDLLKNILGKEWRVRQASCAAIADLLQGRPLLKYEKYLSQIWTLTFKVCDDIKTSVRTAAMALARVLTGILIRSLEAAGSSTATANTMLKEVLPFLLSPSGLESSAKEVQTFALMTLLKVIKAGNNKVLRPFLPELIGRLLALLSSLEPEEVNYLHLNADKYGITSQQLDDARLSSVKMSPMMEAIERCLDMLDEASMKELQQSLTNAIKTVIGLPSKVGVSRVLVSLSTRHNFLFKPYAGSFLKLVRNKQVLDRNDTVSTSAAAACGYLARISSNEDILALVEFCKKLFFDSEDERHRVISGELAFAMGKYATDRFASLAGSILPFVFLAKHDNHKPAKELFTSTWEDNVGGSRAVLLYLKEIITLSSGHLDSQLWSIKHTSAFAIADVVSSAGTDISNMDAATIWPAMEKAIGGKTWDGKERVLEAFVLLAKNSTLLESSPDIAEQMQRIIVRESKRNNADYRQHSLACLGDFVEISKSVDWFEQVYSITEPLIVSLLDAGDTEMDIDSKQIGGLSSKKIFDYTIANALRALLRSINPTLRQDQRAYLESSLSKTLMLVEQALRRADRVVQNAVFDGEKELFQRLAHLEGLSDLDCINGFVDTLFGSDNMPEQTRTKAAEAVEALANLTTTGTYAQDTLRKRVESACEKERSYSVRQIWQRVTQLLAG